MKVKIFVDWSRQEIMSQAEGEALLASQMRDQENYADYRCDCLDDIIEEWLGSKIEVHHSEYYRKLVDLTAEEREELEAKCREEYQAQVESDFFEDWDEVWVEV